MRLGSCSYLASVLYLGYPPHCYRGRSDEPRSNSLRLKDGVEREIVSKLFESFERLTELIILETVLIVVC